MCRGGACTRARLSASRGCGKGGCVLPSRGTLPSPAYLFPAANYDAHYAMIPSTHRHGVGRHQNKPASNSGTPPAPSSTCSLIRSSLYPNGLRKHFSFLSFFLSKNSPFWVFPGLISMTSSSASRGQKGQSLTLLIFPHYFHRP